MEIKTLRPHCNAYGDTFQKKKGDVYTHPFPVDLLATGIAEALSDGGDTEIDNIAKNESADPVDEDVIKPKD